MVVKILLRDLKLDSLSLFVAVDLKASAHNAVTIVCIHAV